MQTKRLTNLDALRGIAVILMVEQHLGAWFWDVPWHDTSQLLNDYPLFMGFNALGGLAAPLFVLLSGIGAALYLNNPARNPRIVIKRGAVIILFGYLLSILTPCWLSPGAWYVLHLIGLCLILAPALHRLPTTSLLLLVVVVCGFATFLQHVLDTPFAMGDDRMADASLPGGVFRLAFVEGHFPIFPWLGYHLAGIAIGKWFIEAKNSRILIFASISAATGIGLAAASPLFESGLMNRTTFLSPLFYPFMPPLYFLLLAASAVCVWLAFITVNRFSLADSNPLVCLGRVSLSVLMLHIFIGRQLGTWLNLSKSFSTPATMAIIVLSIATFLAAAGIWHRYSYRFSLEWLMRKA